MKITILGNCQAALLADAIKFMLRTDQVRVCLEGSFAKSSAASLDELFDCDVIFHQKTFDPSKYNLLTRTRCVLYPRILFRGFHPDMIYVFQEGTSLETKFGAYHSAIVFASFMQELSEEDTLALFTEESFNRLDYFAKYDRSVLELIEEGCRCDLDLSTMIVKWRKRGCFMHTISHPKIHVIADIANVLLGKLGLTPWTEYAADFLTDHLQRGPVCGIYPPIAAEIGLDGSYAFKGPDRLGSHVGNLKEFINESFVEYKKYPKKSLIANPSDISSYQVLFDVSQVQSQKHSKDGVKKNYKSVENPYKTLPDYQFWSRSVTNLPLVNIDPVVNMPFSIARTDRVATGGSCFAQHIAHTLQRIGHNYFVTETPEKYLTVAEAARKNYGIFSARYGNLYTARQLIQLFDRAYGHFVPMDTTWERSDGMLVDPFRPQIEPDGFASKTELLDSRQVHFTAVRKMFAELDVFIFTLGLTEAWQSKKDSAVFPLAPGVSGGVADLSRYEFVNFSAKEVELDLRDFISRLKGVNSKAKILLTVSPVPLIATYEKRSIITSTCYSKSALRVAAEEICRDYTDVAYFPSYELITGHFSQGKYYENDMRNVRPEGVAHAMRLFVAHTVPDSDKQVKTAIDLDSMFDVICDEEQIETVNNG